MDKQPAEKDLLGTVVAERFHQPPGSGEPRAASGSLGDEGNAAQAVLSTTLQQLVSATATTSSATSPISPTVPEALKISKYSAPLATPAKQADEADGPTVAIARPPGITPFNNRQQRFRAAGPYELRCEVLDNQQGIFEIDGPLTIYCSQLLGDKGVIRASGRLTIVCSEFHNQEGQVGSYQSTLTVTTRYALRNQQGAMFSKSHLILDSQQGLLDNRKGSIASESALTIVSSAIRNRAGSLQANEAVTIDSVHLSGAGTISGGTLQLHLHSQQSHCHRGTLQASGSVTLNARGEWRNYGQVQAGERLTIEAPIIRNRAQGVLLAAGPSKIVVTQSAGGEFTNYGLIDSARTEIACHTLNNLGGGTIQGNQLALTADLLTNDGRAAQGQKSASIAARRELTITARQLRNSGGAAVRSAGTLVVSGSFNQSQQHVVPLQSLENHAATISAAELATIHTRTYTHDAASTLEAGKRLTLVCDTLVGAGRISSGGVLLINLCDKQPVAIHGALQAGETLRITAPGELNNYACWEASAEVTVEATFLHNHAEGSIRSAGETKLVLTGGEAGRMDNRGIIDGITTEVRGHRLNNLDSGAIYADRLLLAAEELNNNCEQVSDDSKAIIAARQWLKVGAQRISNREGTLIVCSGPMAIGATLDAQQQLKGQALKVINESATIDIHGDADFNVAIFNNCDAHFKTCEVQVGVEPHQEFQQDGQVSRTWLDKPWSWTTPDSAYMNMIAHIQNHCDACRRIRGGGEWKPYKTIYKPRRDFSFGMWFEELCHICERARQISGHTLYWFQRSITETHVASQLPGKLLVGGNLHFTGSALNNDKSRVVIGGVLTGTLKEINQIEAGGSRTITDEGRCAHVIYTEEGYDLYFTRCIPRLMVPRDWSPYRACKQEPLSLGVAVAQYHSTPSHSDTQIVARQPLVSLAALVEVTAVAHHPISNLSMVVRTATPDITLTVSGLFSVNRASDGGALITTDSLFAGVRHWLSAEDVLQEHRLTFSHLGQWLGDGFYQQQRVREQVLALTNRRFLPGCESDEGQYRLLLTNGIAAGQAYALVPGEALSANQMAQLTQPIVWPVVKQVALAGGGDTEAVALQLYIPMVSALAPTGGALISASEIRVELEGDLYNSGTLIASKVLSVGAGNINNQQGTIHGSVTQLSARHDVNNCGGKLGGETLLRVHAGNDFRAITDTITTTTGGPDGQHQATCTALNARAKLSVSQPGAVMEIHAERDNQLTAAWVVNAAEGGHTHFSSGRDIHLNAARLTQRQAIHGANYTFTQGETYDTGTQIKAVGDIHLQAGRHVKATAAQMISGVHFDNSATRTTTSADLPTLPAGSSSANEHLVVGSSSANEHLVVGSSTTLITPTPATGSLYIQAGQNIDILAGSRSYYDETKGSWSSSTNVNQDVLNQQPTLAVQGERGDLTAIAGRDLNLTSATLSNASAAGKTALSAGNNLALQTGERESRQKCSDVMQRASKSVVGSKITTAGALRLGAGHDIIATAVQLRSGEGTNPHSPGNLLIEAGNDINILAGHVRQSGKAERHSWFSWGQRFSSEAAQCAVGNEITASGALQLCAGRNVTATAAQLTSGTGQDTPGNLHIGAGNNVNIQAGQASHYHECRNGSSFHATQQAVGHVASKLAVAGCQSVLAVVAKGDTHLTAVQIDNPGAAGNTILAAGHHLTLGAVQTAQKDEWVKDKNNFLKRSATAEVGSTIDTVGEIQLQAGGDFTAKCATVNSRAGALQVVAKRNLAIQAGEATALYDEATQRTERGFFRKKTITTRDIHWHATAIGSSFSGNRVLMVAGDKAVTPADGHLTIRGSHVASHRDTTLAANTLTISSAENYQQHDAYRSVKKSGIFGSSGTLVIGSQEMDSQRQRAISCQQSSTISSRHGNVRLLADHYQQHGSDVLALEGSVEVAAADTLAIVATQNQRQLTQESHFHQEGLTIGVSNPLLSGLSTLQQLQQASEQMGEGHLQPLAIAAAALTAKNVYDVTQLNPQQLGGIYLGANLGSQERHSSSYQSQQSAHPARVVAGDDVKLTSKKRLTLQGSEVQAGNTALLEGQQLALLASESHGWQCCKQENSSSSIGIGGGSDGISLSISEGQGDAEGVCLTHTNSQIQAKNLIIRSGGDVTMRGALAAAEHISGTIGGNLTIESLQEREQSHSQQQQISGSLSLGPHSVSGSLNWSETTTNSDFASVRQQSGLVAGSRGWQLAVKEHTHLEGGIIASNQTAIDAGVNRLATASISHRAIENRADYQGQQITLGGGISKSLGKGATEQQPLEDTASSSDSGVGRNQAGEVVSGSNQVPGSRLPNLKGLSAGIPIILSASGSAHSTTRSGISGAVITLTNPEQQWARTGQTPEQAIASLNRQVTSEQESSNTLAPIFNQAEIEAGFAIVGTLVREAGTFLAHRCQEIGQKRAQANDLIAQAEDITQPRTPANRRALRQQADQLHQQAQAIEKRWGMGSNGRLLLTALTAAAGGNVTGSAGAMLQAAAVNTLQGLGARQVKLIADSLESETARTALHAVLAGIGAAAQGQNITSAALGAGASVVLNNLVKVAYEQDEQDPLNLEQREACKNLVTTLIAGTTQALGGEAAVASVAATLEAENNSVAVAAVPATGSAALTLTIEEIAAYLSVATDEVLAVLTAAGTVGLTAGSVIGITALPGLLYECGIDRQIQREVAAITEGRRDIEQVIAERGLERARLIELSLVEKQLLSHLTPDEQSQIRHLGHECLPLPGIVECRRKFLQAMWAKYHPEAPLTLKTFTPALPHHTGGTPPQVDIPLHTGDPAPEIELPRHTSGNQTPETTAQDPLIFVPGDPTLTQMPPGGAPVEVLQPLIVIEKRQGKDENRRRDPQPQNIFEPDAGKKLESPTDGKWSMEGRLTGLKLPVEGEFPFIPPKSYKPSMPLEKGNKHGYLDRFDNEWTKGRSVTPGQHFEWDVIRKNGDHINVSWDGKITHGKRPGE